MFRWSLLAALLSTGVILTSGSSVCAAPKDFRPERHFPEETYCYISGDVGEIRKAFRKTPLGSMLFHPSVIAALGTLPKMVAAQIESETSFFENDVGVPFLQFFDMFRGRVSMTWPTIDARRGPRILIACELTTRGKEIIKFADAVAKSEGRGQDPIKERYKTVDIYRWQVRYGPPFAHAVVGDHLIFSINGANLEEVIDLWAGSSSGGLSKNSELRSIKRRTEVASGKSLLTAYLNWRGIQDALIGSMQGRDERSSGITEFRAFLKASGFEKLQGIGLQVGLEDGDWEGKFYLDCPEGQAGAIKLLGEVGSAPSSHDGLAQLPASASAVYCSSFHTGTFVRQLVKIATEAVPEIAPEVEEFISKLESGLGLKVKRDFYTLGRLDMYGVLVTPPAGGLPDDLALFRFQQARPYLALLDRVAKKFGARPREVNVLGHDVTYLRIAGFARAAGIVPDVPDAGAPDLGQQFLNSMMDPAMAISFAVIDDEWLVVGNTPQAVGRYLAIYSKGEKFSDSEELMNMVQSRIGQKAAFIVLRGGGFVLSIYNTLLSMANRLAPDLEEFLKPYDIDLAKLPAGEVFAPQFKDGFLRILSKKDSVLIHGHRAFTNSMLVVGLPVIAMAGLGFVMQTPAVRSHQRGVVAIDSVGHTSRATASGEIVVGTPPKSPAEKRLAEVGKLMQEHMKKTKSRAYPHSPDGKVSGFQALMKSGVLGDPSMLVHPFSSDRPVRAGGEIKDANCSYYLVPWRQGARDNPSRILCYEKQAFRKGGRLVLYVDLSVKFHKEDEFQSIFRKQLARYGKKLKPSGGK